MRILLVNKFIFPKGGAETYTFDVGKMLEEHGHEVQYFGLENEKNIVGNRVGSYVTNGFDFYDFTFCPCCGCLMPFPLKKLKGFFEVYNIHSALLDAIQLIYKSEFESAAREAFVALENYFKKKSGLDSHGFDLVTRALSFEIDKQTGEIKRAPLIAINDLKNESQRNEGEYHCAS